MQKLKRLAYAYDANGNRTLLVDPDGLTTRCGYDALNRVASVTATGAGVTNTGYYRDSRSQQVTYPNGALARHAYDAAGRLQLLDNLENTNTAVSRFVYSFDTDQAREGCQFATSSASRAVGWDGKGPVLPSSPMSSDDSVRLLGQTRSSWKPL